MRNYTTPRGKDVEIYPEGNLWKIQFTNGGELPGELAGAFTSEGIAAQRTELYIKRLRDQKNPPKEQ